MQILYNILSIFVVILAIPMFCLRLIREEGFGERLKQSWGFLPATELIKVAGKGCIWVHAASVGEVVAASPVVKEIKREFSDTPLLVTVVTSTGYSMAHAIIPEADAILYFPLDLPFLSHHVVKKIKPGVFIPVETELWPNCLAAMRKFGVPVMLANGRISERSTKRYRYLFGLLTDMLAGVNNFCMQSQVDADHIIKLGADPKRVFVTGNTKYDQTYNQVAPEEKVELIKKLGIYGKSPVIIAGSTHPGEEDPVFTAFEAVKAKYDQAVLILAPRSILRAEEIKNMAQKRGFSVELRTNLNGSRLTDVIILNTIGELGRIYSLGDIIFVGGSLIPQGGHNVLEPAAHGKPIIVGPHMQNFQELFDLLYRRGACIRVENGDQLGRVCLDLMDKPEWQEKMSTEALKIIAENRGATRKLVKYLKDLVAKE